MTIPRVVLASASPRRHELLQQLGVAHEQISVDIDENCLSSETPSACVERLAKQKARAGLQEMPDAIVIGSDTMVVVDEHVMGKPRNREDAVQMLELLSGRSHEVFSAVAVANAEQQKACVQRSEVTFRALQAKEILAYWETGEPRDKAGGYAIQGIAALFVRQLNGSYSGVMGLPLYETALLLQDFGIKPLEVFNA